MADFERFRDSLDVSDNSQQCSLLHDLLEGLLAVDLDGRVVLLGRHLGLAHRREPLPLLPRKLPRLLQVPLVVRLLLLGELNQKSIEFITFC